MDKRNIHPRLKLIPASLRGIGDDTLSILFMLSKTNPDHFYYRDYGLSQYISRKLSARGLISKTELVRLDGVLRQFWRMTEQLKLDLERAQHLFMEEI